MEYSENHLKNHSEDSSKSLRGLNKRKSLVSITIARQSVCSVNSGASSSKSSDYRPGQSSRPTKNLKNSETRTLKQGGFIRGGQDGAELDLITTHSGLNALRIFSKIGSLKPIYLNQEFFDSV